MNLTRDEARQFRDLLLANLGGRLSIHQYNTTSFERVDKFGKSSESTEMKVRTELELPDGTHREVEWTDSWLTLKRYTAGVAYAEKRLECSATTVDELVDKVVAEFPELEKRYQQELVKNKAEKEKLAARVDLGRLLEDKALTKFKLVDYKYDCGDDRSSGSLEVTAKTDAGELKLSGPLDTSGSLDELTVTLDGKEVDDDSLPGFDPGTPHFYSGERAVNAWKKNAEKNLKAALKEYLGLD